MHIYQIFICIYIKGTTTKSKHSVIEIVFFSITRIVKQPTNSLKRKIHPIV